MSKLVDKLCELERVSASLQGGYYLFSLFKPRDRAFGWDLVVSAPWLQDSRRSNYELMSKFLSETLDEEELLEISRVVVLDEDNSLVQRLYTINQEHILDRIEHFENEEGQPALVLVITAQENPSFPVKSKKGRRRKTRDKTSRV